MNFFFQTYGGETKQALFNKTPWLAKKFQIVVISQILKYFFVVYDVILNSLTVTVSQLKKE
jgi:hypothetical protein